MELSMFFLWIIVQNWGNEEWGIHEPFKNTRGKCKRATITVMQRTRGMTSAITSSVVVTRCIRWRTMYNTSPVSPMRSDSHCGGENMLFLTHDSCIGRDTQTHTIQYNAQRYTSIFLQVHGLIFLSACVSSVYRIRHAHRHTCGILILHQLSLPSRDASYAYVHVDSVDEGNIPSPIFRTYPPPIHMPCVPLHAVVKDVDLIRLIPNGGEGVPVYRHCSHMPWITTNTDYCL